jgi:O-glycosyl hydrolase
LFAPGVGANFTVCRMPIGANDFSLDWYSYDEVPDDFSLQHFSISRDLETLVPFIKGALVSTRPEALGLALEPSDLDENQQALRSEAVRAGHAAQRVETRSGEERGHRPVHPG